MLSFQKLMSFIDKRGYLCSTVYTFHSKCIYLEVTCKKKSNIYYIYIPSKYDILIPTSGTKYNCVELKYISDVFVQKNVLEQYAGGDTDESYKNYKNIILDPRYNVSRDIEGLLSNQYEKQIELDKKATYQNNDLKCIVRQLSRLQNCFSQIEYKLVLVYKKYLCVICRDNSVDCYFVQKLHFPKRNLFITFDLEMLYSTTSYDLENDLNKVKQSMYKIFKTNRENHLRNIMSMFTNQSSMINTIQIINKTDKKISNDLSQHQLLLHQLNQKESSTHKSLQKLIKEKSSFTQDSKQIRKKNNLIASLKKIIELQNEILKGSTNAYQCKNNLLLEVDNILFDNIVLLDQIHQNFNILDQILKKNI